MTDKKVYAAISGVASALAEKGISKELIAQGIPEEFAQKALLAIAGGKVQDAHIKY